MGRFYLFETIVEVEAYKKLHENYRMKYVELLKNSKNVTETTMVNDLNVYYQSAVQFAEQINEKSLALAELTFARQENIAPSSNLESNFDPQQYNKNLEDTKTFLKILHREFRDKWSESGNCGLLPKFTGRLWGETSFLIADANYNNLLREFSLWFCTNNDHIEVSDNEALLVGRELEITSYLEKAISQKRRELRTACTQYGDYYNGDFKKIKEIAALQAQEINAFAIDMSTRSIGPKPHADTHKANLDTALKALNDLPDIYLGQMVDEYVLKNRAIVTFRPQTVSEYSKAIYIILNRLLDATFDSLNKQEKNFEHTNKGRQTSPTIKPMVITQKDKGCI